MQYSAYFRTDSILLADFKRFTQFDWKDKHSIDDFPHECILICPLVARLKVDGVKIYFDIGRALRRYLFESYHRVSAKSFLICHKCTQINGTDQMGLCVNPRHYQLGTRYDNKLDSRIDRQLLRQKGHEMPEVPAIQGTVIRISYNTPYSKDDDAGEQKGEWLSLDATSIPTPYLPEDPLLQREPSCARHFDTDELLRMAQTLIQTDSWKDRVALAHHLGQRLAQSVAFDRKCAVLCSTRLLNWDKMILPPREVLIRYYQHSLPGLCGRSECFRELELIKIKRWLYDMYSSIDAEVVWKSIQGFDSQLETKNES